MSTIISLIVYPTTKKFNPTLPPFPPLGLYMAISLWKYTHQFSRKLVAEGSYSSFSPYESSTITWYSILRCSLEELLDKWLAGLGGISLSLTIYTSSLQNLEHFIWWKSKSSVTQLSGILPGISTMRVFRGSWSFESSHFFIMAFHCGVSSNSWTVVL